MPISVRLRVAPLLAALLLAACGGHGSPNTAAAQLSFGVNMAQRGLWDEALFRFLQAERLAPDNPRIQNNIGVAYEAAGEFDRALEHYQKALRLAPNDREMRANYARFVEFYQSFKGEKTGTDKAAASPPGTTPGQPARPQPPASPDPSTPEDEPPPPVDGRPPV
ncbi:MAG TPA: tetratricopeptide repeat protein [Thermoanaerobaculia bacterium]|nr:tetratricopeptide repeat protein [Thermoanaerobaculia bacterium]